eukprot:gene11931-24996_t
MAELVNEQSRVRHQTIFDNYVRWVDKVKDPENWAKACFTEDAKFRIGNFPISTGHDQISQAAQGMYNMCTSLEHTCSKTYSINDDLFITEGTVIYTIASGRVLDPIPICAVYNLQSGTDLIVDYKAYMDVNPLMISIGLDITEGENGAVTPVPRAPK